jgi:pimeloyl-ACP methyl ester carboxylesterase
MAITEVTTEDGRTLEVMVADRREGLPLVFHNGLPSAVVPYPPFDEAAESNDMYVVTYSRPGYGASTPWPEDRDPQIADDVADTRLILDTLGIEEFVTLGWSGGGPRALATAALMPDRCLAAASLAGVAPVGEGGMSREAWVQDMGPENVRDFDAAVAGREVLRPVMAAEVEEFKDVTRDDIVAAFGQLVTEVDAAALTGEFAEYVASDFRRSVENGMAGIFEDTLMVTRPWGFDLGSIPVPVAVWQGRHDAMVPYGHGQWLAENVSGAQARLFEDEGHLTLVRQLPAILADLRELAGR